MIRLSLKTIIACALGLSTSAAAGTIAQPAKYSIENGVNVYRNQLSPTQQMAANAHLAALVRSEQRQNYHTAMIRLQETRARNQTAAYERGFKDGVQQAQSLVRLREHHSHNRVIRQRRPRYIAYLGNTYRGYGRLHKDLKPRRYTR